MHDRPGARPTAVSPEQHDLLFTFDFPPMGGGIARWMQAIAECYPRGTLTVSTGLMDGAAATDAALPNRVDRVNVNAKRLRTVQGTLQWARRGVQLARETGARFSWCANVRPAGWPVYWTQRAAGVPYGLLFYGSDVHRFRAKLESPFKRRAYRPLLERASAYVGCSNWTASLVRDMLDSVQLSSRVPRVRAIPLGTHAERWRATPADVAAFRRSRNLPDGRYLVTVARLVEHKGVDVAIEALASLGEDGRDVRYLVVGSGPDEQRLRSIAAARGVADRVHFATNVADDELRVAYASAEVYVGLSREQGVEAEGFGIAFIEAAASGLPVVAGASGGVSDAVEGGVTGMLVQPTDVSSAARALSMFLDDRERAARFGRAGRERAEHHFTWTRVIGEMRSLAAQLGRHAS